MTKAVTAPYGSWKSPITSDLIVAESIGLTEVRFDGDDIYWIEARPREAGRSVVVRRTPDGRITDLTPPPFNVRTRVHEYGGGAAAIADGTVYFSHFPDQRLYRQQGEAPPIPITPEGGWRYADGVVDRRRNRWIGVREDHSAPGREPVNTIVAIDLGAGGAGQVLVGGSDFFASPRLSPDGMQLAWLSWSHPNMPWIGTELWVGGIATDGSLQHPAKVAGGDEESIFQPEWSPDGRLHFVSDRSGWWNLYRQEGDGRCTALCPRAAEFGRPQWQFGMSTYGFISAHELICSYIEDGYGHLARLDLSSLSLTPIDLPYGDYASVRADGHQVVFCGGAPTRPTGIVRLDLPTGETEVLRTASPAAADPALSRYFVAGQPISYPTEGGDQAHGLYYPPHNPDYEPPHGEKAPLVVKCHGGPTSAASTTLNLGIQYWTSRGIGVLDVNYRGSTGYGRDYRSRLHLRWGVADVDDCVHGARYLVNHRNVDEQRLVITGSSAGGYTVLAALTFRNDFKGGASHYGISDAEALARDTHKFESRYLDWLLGPYPEQREVYRQRSPIYHADQLNVPVIFFQGEEDRIVPPNQTDMMVDALRRRSIPVGYLLFSGEQHGFRQAANVKRALDAELYFYSVLVFRTGLTF